MSIDTVFDVAVFKRIREEAQQHYPLVLEEIATTDSKKEEFSLLLQLCEKEEWYDWCILIRDFDSGR